MRKPRPRKRFISSGDECNHLCDLLKYSLAKSLPAQKIVISRMRVLLDKCGKDDGSITLQEWWFVYHLATGNVRLALVHLRREIRYVEYYLSKYEPIANYTDEYVQDRKQEHKRLRAELSNR